MTIIRRILGKLYTMNIREERLQMLFDGDRASSIQRSLVTVQDLVKRRP